MASSSTNPSPRRSMVTPPNFENSIFLFYLLFYFYFLLYFLFGLLDYLNITTCDGLSVNFACYV
ncbi:hypothetical protein LguiB_027651 [Lonicera macranthoides]